MKCNERIKRWMHFCWEWCWVELFPTTHFFPWCTAMHWNGEASLYWLVKTLQHSSSSSWPWCKVKCTKWSTGKERGSFRTRIWKGSPTSMALVDTSSKLSCAFLSGCFFAHIYHPAQIAEKNQRNVYVCVHMSVKCSNNNSITAAVVYDVNFFSFVII